MGLLVTLNEDGYQTLKKDREVIMNKIKELEIVLNELNPAFKHLQPFYEPKIDISIIESKGEINYIGKVFVAPAHRFTRRQFSFTIGSVKKYEDINDIKLLEDAKIIARGEIAKFYPSYFE